MESLSYIPDVDRWWNDTGNETPKYSEKNFSAAILSATDLTQTYLGYFFVVVSCTPFRLHPHVVLFVFIVLHFALCLYLKYITQTSVPPRDFIFVLPLYVVYTALS